MKVASKICMGSNGEVRSEMLEGVEDVDRAFWSEKLDPEDIGAPLRVVKIPSQTEVDPLGAMPAQISGNQVFCDFQRRGP